MNNVDRDKVILELVDLVHHCRLEISQIKLDIRHVQNQTTDFNTRLINLTMKIEKSIRLQED